MNTERKPIVDKSTGISIGLALVLAALIIGWTTNDASFKSDMKSSMNQVSSNIEKIQGDLEKKQEDIIDLKVRVALLEREVKVE